MSYSNIELPSNRKFGFFFAAVFLGIGAYCFSAEASQFGLTASVVAGVFFLVTIIHADWLYPLNRAWMMFGLLLGKIVSPLVLGLIYFGLFTPVSLMTKLFGRDELRLKLKVRPSHWKPKNIDAPQLDTFKHQF